VILKEVIMRDVRCQSELAFANHAYMILGSLRKDPFLLARKNRSSSVTPAAPPQHRKCKTKP